MQCRFSVSFFAKRVGRYKFSLAKEIRKTAEASFSPLNREIWSLAFSEAWRVSNFQIVIRYAKSCRFAGWVGSCTKMQRKTRTSWCPRVDAGAPRFLKGHLGPKVVSAQPMS